MSLRRDVSFRPRVKFLMLCSASLIAILPGVAQAEEDHMYENILSLRAALQMLYTRLKIILHSTVALP